MKTTHTIHTASLNNNCPICYGKDGLQLEFTQQKKENKFYEKALSEISSTMHCSTCNSAIFPVNWTEDIERVYEYNRKLAKPLPTAIRLKPLFYLIILADALLVGALIYYFA
ncbi:hypothetical protein G5B37_08110 [Rasiella rasia]|uniref:Uncharacterized protein n=1 Tax=Rasiella rasia TaxID=2744027 RepID=A0A6G6GLY3_9FLAO|nr:hypothetical protein [Rasiella rasia]QIE59527.1 hypothetical protein G5B37_08110 [Rasiella rasia]